MDNINVNLNKIHKCSICKKVFFWSNQSCWYGYYDKNEKIKVLEKCCSRACYNKSKYRDLLNDTF